MLRSLPDVTDIFLASLFIEVKVSYSLEESIEFHTLFRHNL